MEKIYRCKHCGKEFNNPNKLRGHSTHCDKNPNKLKLCNFNIKKHNQTIRKIDEYREVNCQYCNKQYFSLNSLRQHEIRCKENPNKIKSNIELYNESCHTVWNKGLTKETNNSVKLQAQTLHNLYIVSKCVNKIKETQHIDEQKLSTINYMTEEIVTYDICYKAAKYCTTLYQFRTLYYSYYIKSFKLKWLDDFNWLTTYEYKWNKETTYAEAKKYKYLSDFRKNSAGAYKAAYKHKWLLEYTWLEKKVYNKNDKQWYVYVYEFPNNQVYVGLTVNIKRRHYDHKARIHKDSLAKYCYKNNLILPDYIIKYSNLNSEDALYYEDLLKKQYKENNWQIINKGNTGIGSGSLGSSMNKWSKEKVYEVAKDCISRNDLKLKFPRAYRLALDNNWMNDFIWFKSKNELYYNKVYLFNNDYQCINVFDTIAAAAKYLNKNSSNIKSAIIKHNKAFGYYWSHNKEYLNEFKK